ncbi:unnamed protein product [Alopecurus aequalis]
MPFAGASLIRDGKLCPSASAIDDAGSVSGYHLLVVEAYSRIKNDVLNGGYIDSRSFRVGGYLWFLRLYPNGMSSTYADFISAALVLAQNVAMPVNAKYELSFIDQTDRQEPSRILARKAFDFHIKYGGMCYPHFVKRDHLENSKYLKHDSFTIRCDVVVNGSASPFVKVPSPDMQRHFTDLLMAKEGADVTFKVGGETFPAHRCVLAARSTVFKAEIFGPMKEGSMATAGVIHVEEMERQTFRAMLKFIYTDLEPELGEEEDEAVMWQHLLAAADRYDLERLKLMCEDKLCGLIKVNTITTILALAKSHGCDGLKKACYNFFAAPGNAKTVMATDGFDHLMSRSPSVVKELFATLAL